MVGVVSMSVASRTGGPVAAGYESPTHGAFAPATPDRSTHLATKGSASACAKIGSATNRRGRAQGPSKASSWGGCSFLCDPRPACARAATPSGLIGRTSFHPSWAWLLMQASEASRCLSRELKSCSRPESVKTPRRVRQPAGGGDKLVESRAIATPQQFDDLRDLGSAARPSSRRRRRSSSAWAMRSNPCEVVVRT